MKPTPKGLVTGGPVIKGQTGTYTPAGLIVDGVVTPLQGVPPIPGPGNNWKPYSSTGQ